MLTNTQIEFLRALNALLVETGHPLVVPIDEPKKEGFMSKIYYVDAVIEGGFVGTLEFTIEPEGDVVDGTATDIRRELTSGDMWRP